MRLSSVHRYRAPRHWRMPLSMSWWRASRPLAECPATERAAKKPRQLCRAYRVGRCAGGCNEPHGSAEDARKITCVSARPLRERKGFSCLCAPGGCPFGSCENAVEKSGADSSDVPMTN